MKNLTLILLLISASTLLKAQDSVDSIFYAKNYIKSDCFELEEIEELTISPGRRDLGREERLQRLATLEVLSFFKSEAVYQSTESIEEATETFLKVQCMLREEGQFLSRRQLKSEQEEYLSLTGLIAQEILRKKREDISPKELETLFKLRTTGIKEIDDLGMSRNLALSYLDKYSHITRMDRTVVEATEKGIEMLIKVHQMPHSNFSVDDKIRDFRKALKILSNQEVPGATVSFWRNKIGSEAGIHP